VQREVARGIAEVLVIEDDPGDALLAEEYLAEEADDFGVRWAPSLAEGIDAIGSTTACVLLDLNLPDAKGVDALERLRAAAPRVPVVVLTGFGDREAGVYAVAGGAQDYLVKGEVSPDTLVRSVRYAIARRGNEERDLRLLEAAMRREENRRVAIGLRPKLLVDDDRLVCDSLYQPAGGHALLGGDFLDAVELADGTLRMVVGDVAGHGPEEAALGVALRVGWRSLALAGLTAADALAELDKVLAVERSDPYTFATLVDVSVGPDRRAMDLCIAGHPPPLIWSSSGTAPVGAATVRPLGVPGTSLACTHVDLPERWCMLLYTDGVFERRSRDGTRSDLDTFVASMVAERDDWSTASSAEDLRGRLEGLLSNAEAANGGPLDDDVALLACCRTTR